MFRVSIKRTITHVLPLVCCILYPFFAAGQTAGDAAVHQITNGNAQDQFRQAYDAYGKIQWQPAQSGAASVQGQNYKQLIEQIQNRHGMQGQKQLGDFNLLTVAEVNAQKPIDPRELKAFLDWWPEFAATAQRTGGSVANMQKIVKDNKWNWPRFYTIWMRLISYQTKSSITRMDAATNSRLQQQKQMILQNRSLPEAQRQMIMQQIDKTVHATQNRTDTPEICAEDQNLFAANGLRIGQVFDSHANLGAQ